MVNIHEENLVITVSRLVKSGATPKPLLTSEIISDLEKVAQELVGDAAVVEIIKANE